MITVFIARIIIVCGKGCPLFSQITLANVIVKIQNELVIIRVSEAMMSIHMRW